MACRNHHQMAAIVPQISADHCVIAIDTNSTYRTCAMLADWLADVSCLHRTFELITRRYLRGAQKLKLTINVSALRRSRLCAG